jgi:hypothetical protein
LNQAELRLKSQFPDFEAVVTVDNLKKLAATKPALHRVILANQDAYDAGYTAYEVIKNSGLIDTSYAEQDRKIEENKYKPRAAANAAPQVGDSPLSRVGDYDRRVLTEDRKMQLLKQVADAKMHR